MASPVIIRSEKTIDKPLETLWSIVEPAENISYWFAMCNKSELIEGEGKGRLQKIYTKWGRKLVEIEQQVTDYKPMRLVRWRHVKELMNGKPAPAISKQVFFTVELLPADAGTHIILLSENLPGNFLKRILIQIIAKPRIKAVLEKSLQKLSD